MLWNKLGQIDDAIKAYTKVINDEAKKASLIHYNTAIERRAITYFQTKDFVKAKNDFELMAIEVRTEISNVKSHYYIGKIYSKMDSINDAILHFEQVLKFDNQKYFAGNALYEMTKIHIKQK